MYFDQDFAEWHLRTFGFFPDPGTRGCMCEQHADHLARYTAETQPKRHRNGTVCASPETCLENKEQDNATS